MITKLTLTAARLAASFGFSPVPFEEAQSPHPPLKGWGLAFAIVFETPDGVFSAILSDTYTPPGEIALECRHTLISLHAQAKGSSAEIAALFKATIEHFALHTLPEAIARRSPQPWGDLSS